MVRYVLTADYTLMSDYRGIPLATFFSCLTSDFWTSRVAFRALANPPKLGEDGLPLRAPYGLRKIEAALVQAVGRSNVVVADPRTLDRHIGPDTEIVGIHTMDPLGLGPVSMTFTYGGLYTPYTKAMFLDAVRRASAAPVCGSSTSGRECRRPSASTTSFTESPSTLSTVCSNGLPPARRIPSPDTRTETRRASTRCRGS